MASLASTQRILATWAQPPERTERDFFFSISLEALQESECQTHNRCFLILLTLHLALLSIGSITFFKIALK